MACTEVAPVRLEPCIQGTVMPRVPTLSASNTKSIITEPLLCGLSPPPHTVTSSILSSLSPLCLCFSLLLSPSVSSSHSLGHAQFPITDSVSLSLSVSFSAFPQALVLLLYAALSMKRGTTCPVSPCLLSCFSSGPDRSVCESCLQKLLMLTFTAALLFQATPGKHVDSQTLTPWWPSHDPKVAGGLVASTTWQEGGPCRHQGLRDRMHGL